MRRWLKKWLPHHSVFHCDNRLTSWLSHYPYLWQLNKKSVARGVFSGLLVAFIPLPIQMLLAAILAFLFRANLPIALVATWITNPITFVPFNLLIYKIGTIIIHNKNGLENIPPLQEFKLKWHDIYHLLWQTLHWLGTLGKIYVIGLIIISIIAALLGYGIVRLSWRIVIGWQWQRRKKAKKNSNLLSVHDLGSKKITLRRKRDLR